MSSENAGALKVLHVAETIRGGIATYLNELHPHQRASFGRGNVHYIVPSDQRDDLGNFGDAEVSVFQRAGRSEPRLLGRARATVEQIHPVQPDILHTDSTFAGFAIRPSVLF